MKKASWEERESREEIVGMGVNFKSKEEEG